MDKEWIQIGLNVLLLLLTLSSIYYAKRTVQIAKKQIKLSSNPVIGIEVNEIGISTMYADELKRRNMRVELEIANIGNDPAIEIVVDGEIQLEFSNINGENIIPSRFDSAHKSFLMAKEKFSDIRIDLHFGNIFLKHFFESCRMMKKLNQERIKNTPWKEAYQTAKLIVYVYYANNIGQYFKSTYEIYIDIEGKIPGNNETGKVRKVYVPKPVFTNKIISKKDMDNEIAKRNKKRHLCGY